MKTTLKCLIGLGSFFVIAKASLGATPARLPLPLDGEAFFAHNIEFDSSGARVCITGSDLDDMGNSTTRLLLIDRSRDSVLWQKTIPVPEALAVLDPVQCVVGTDRVYLLANAETSPAPSLAQSRAYVFAFGMSGNQIASRQLDIPGRSWYGYAMSDASGGLKVAGYIRDQERDTERYATYTVTLDPKLQQRGAPLLRKNGAYTYPLGARIVGDSIYVSGRFLPATVPEDFMSSYATSRLRTDGGYIWSVRTAPIERTSVHIAVMADGTSYALGYSGDMTTLTIVTPDGKAPPPLTYPSTFCLPRAIARYGSGIVAVRERCKGKGNALVSIDPASGTEQLVKSVRDEPMYVATKGSLWAVLARDKDGKVYLYSAAAGGL